MLFSPFSAKQHPSSAQPKAINLDAVPHHADTEILLLQIEALQSQMKEQAELGREQTEALLEDRRVRIEEMQTIIERDRSKIQSLNEKWVTAIPNKEMVKCL